MEVKVTCPKCGQNASMPAKQVVRAFRCAKCAHRFVPAREGIFCPKCDSVTIISNAKRRHRIICLNCSHVIHEPKWWQKRRYQALLACGAVVLVLLIFMLVRWRSNVALAKELRAEFEAWLATLPKVPDSENGMPVILKGVKAFEDFSIDWMHDENFNVENESDRALLQKYLAKKSNALAVIYEGLNYERFLFECDWREGHARKIPNLLRFKSAGRLIVLKGELAYFQGRKSEVLKEYLNVLQLGRTLSTDRSLISCMTEVAVVQMALEPLTRVLSDSSITEKDLQDALKTLLNQYGKGASYFEVMEGEHYTWLLLLTDTIEGKMGLGDWGFGFNFYYRARFSKFIHNYRPDVKKLRRELEIYRSIDPTRYYNVPLEAKDDNAFLKKIGITRDECSLAAVCVHNYTKAARALAETEVLWRGAIALAGIRLFEARNGRLPKNLAELGELVPKELLTDPFSGNNLIYRISGNDFYLYSVGYDGVDGKPVNVSPYFVKGEPHPGIAPDTIFHAPAAENGK